MGTGLNLPNLNINPGIGGQGMPQEQPFADAAAMFLQAFLGAQGNTVRREEERGRNSRSSEEMEMRRQEHELKKMQLQMQLTDKKIEQENAKTQGKAWQELLPNLLARGFDPSQLLPQAQGSMMPAPQGPQVQVPPQPMQALANVTQGMTPESVPRFVGDAQSLVKDVQGKSDRLANVEKAVMAIKDESKRSGARSLLMFAELGANLPKEASAAMFPELFPEGGAVDPAQMNAATTLFKTGVFSWGQARRQAGLRQIPGIPDDVKYQPFPTRPRQDQLKAGAQLDVMVAAKPVLDAYSTEKSPGLLTSWVKGGKSGGWRELIANPALAAEDRQFLQAARNFTDSWVRVVSGAQTNEQEYARFIAAITEMSGDDPQTREQKRNMRGIMVQAVADIAGGAVTPTEGIDRALKLNWTPRQKAFLMEERKKAVRYEADVKAGKVKVNTGASAPSSPDDFADQVDLMAAAIEQALARRDP